jgi:hypothetical protein
MAMRLARVGVGFPDRTLEPRHSVCREQWKFRDGPSVVPAQMARIMTQFERPGSPFLWPPE